MIHTKILNTGEPKRGDVVVFRYPPQPEINYIKRLIGLPGDKIKFTADKKLYINGQLVNIKPDKPYPTKTRNGKTLSVTEYNEFLPSDVNNKLSHKIIYFPGSSRLVGQWIVPAGHYFMMGDNRDNSSDSRVWGFVPEENLVGKASLVWMHWNWQNGGDGFQSDRIGATVN